jgi:hypothetical protein
VWKRESKKQVALLQPKCLEKQHHAPRFLVGLTKIPGNVRVEDDNNVMGPSTDAMIITFFFFSCLLNHPNPNTFLLTLLSLSVFCEKL